MAAVFPLDTSQPWTFNGVTYQYDAAEDRWFVVSTTATDQVVTKFDDLDRDVDIINTTIDQEIENRTNLLNAAANKNNEQDERLNDLDARLDLVAENIGVLDFAGLFQYFTLITQEFCDNQFVACIEAAGGDASAISACQSEKARCDVTVTTEVPEGQFTSDAIQFADVEYLRVSNFTLGGAEFDWVGIIEPGDFIELVEQNRQDSALFEVLTDARADSENIRVKFVRQTNLGDGGFNDGEIYAVRIFKEERGLDINAADARYVQRPYTVLFSDDPPELGDAFTGVLQNGELWYDTANLEMFVWNNNAWVTAAKPPSQDVVISAALDDISRISGEVHEVSQELNTIDAYLQTRKNIYYSDGAPDAGSNPDGTPRSFNNGDLWIDSDDLNLKFYSQGAWVNPDRQNDSSAEIDALRTEMLNAINAPAHLSWKFDNSTTFEGPAEGYMKRDSSKIWRFSFKTADGIDLGRSLIDDTGTHEWSTQMTIWEHQSSLRWKMKAHYKINKWRWNHTSSSGGSAHFELEQSGVYGEKLSNGSTYYVSVGGWF